MVYLLGSLSAGRVNQLRKYGQKYPASWSAITHPAHNINIHIYTSISTSTSFASILIRIGVIRPRWCARGGGGVVWCWGEVIEQPSSKSQQHLTPFDCLISQIVLWIYSPWPDRPVRPTTVPSVPGTRQWKINTEGGLAAKRDSTCCTGGQEEDSNNSNNSKNYNNYNWNIKRRWASFFTAFDILQPPTAARNNQPTNQRAATQTDSHLNKGDSVDSGGSAGMPNSPLTYHRLPADQRTSSRSWLLEQDSAAPTDDALLCAYSNQIR